jgi:hypothetical protein
MVLKGGVFENKKRKIKGNKDLFFVLEIKIGKAKGTCIENQILCFDIT